MDRWQQAWESIPTDVKMIAFLVFVIIGVGVAATRKH